MKRILLTIAYDGTAYHGWQVQPNGITVQQTLQDSLEKLLGVRPSVTGCSRTDAGVHAHKFCCHLDCNDSFPENAFLRGLNSLLPNDIAVIGCREVRNDFHARYNCLGKKYIYTMYTGVLDPFKSRYKLHIDKEPDIELMNVFCKGVIGKHDFEGFSSSKRSVVDTVRTVNECVTKKDGNHILFEISADGFLYNMVRILAGTALYVGYNRIAPECYETVFNSKNRNCAGETLPPNGLFLEDVYY